MKFSFGAAVQANLTYAHCEGVGGFRSALIWDRCYPLTRGNVFWSEGTAMWIVALSSGALVASLAAFPVATLYSVRPVMISTAAAFATNDLRCGLACRLKYVKSP